MTLKQERWAQSFVKHGNASLAVRESYPNVHGESTKVVGHYNRHSPKVITYVNSLIGDRGKALRELCSDLDVIKSARRTTTKDKIECIKVLARLLGLEKDNSIHSNGLSLTLTLNDNTKEIAKRTLDLSLVTLSDPLPLKDSVTVSIPADVVHESDCKTVNST